MRSRSWLLLPLLLLSGCSSPDQNQEGQEADGLNDAPQGSLKQVLLGERQVFTPGPGEHTFTARVPEGGAVNIAWRLTTSGANLDTRFEGPGCEGSTSVTIGQSNSVGGSCADLKAGPHEFAVVVSGAIASFQAEVTGWVPA